MTKPLTCSRWEAAVGTGGSEGKARHVWQGAHSLGCTLMQHNEPCPWLPAPLQYATLATQIGTIQAAEAPRRTIKAVSPAIKKVKRKAALPPEARGQGAK